MQIKQAMLPAKSSIDDSDSISPLSAYNQMGSAKSPMAAFPKKGFRDSPQCNYDETTFLGTDPGKAKSDLPSDRASAFIAIIDQLELECSAYNVSPT